MTVKFIVFVIGFLVIFLMTKKAVKAFKKADIDEKLEVFKQTEDEYKQVKKAGINPKEVEKQRKEVEKFKNI